MTTEIALAYFHFIALIGTACLLAVEAAMCRPGIHGESLHRLKFIDIAYFSFAIAALATGGMRLFWGEKGSAFYLHNPVFHAKLGLFVLVALLSIVPTLRFVSWSKSLRADAGFKPPQAAVARVRRHLALELIVLASIPLPAAMMAHGLMRLG